MSQLLRVSWLFVLPVLAAPSVSAQSSAESSAIPSKLAASAPAAPLSYRSAFQNYQSYSDSAVVPWKESNTKVKDAGGWRAYAKEAQEPVATDGKAPAAAASNPHSGHH